MLSAHNKELRNNQDLGLSKIQKLKKNSNKNSAAAATEIDAFDVNQ